MTVANDKLEPKFKIGKLYLLVIFLIIALIVVEIWVSHSVVTSGQKYQEIESLQKTLESQNQILEDQVDKLSSLNLIASESAALGFEQPKNIQYIR